MRRILPILCAFLLCLPASQSWEMGARMERRLVAATAGGSSNGLLTGLAVYWSLSDVADDLGAKTLTNNNSVTFSSGKIGNAADFSSASSQSLSYTAGATTGTTAKTWSFWFNPSDQDTAVIFYDGRGDGAGAQARCQIGAAGGGIIRFGLSAAFYNSSLIPATGTWNHIVIVQDGTTLGDCTIWLNGTSEACAGTTAIVASSNGIYIGSDAGSLGIDGAIDEFCIWSRALSAADVAALYNSGSGLPYSSFD